MTWICRVDGRSGDPSSLPLQGLWARGQGPDVAYLMPDLGGEATGASGERFKLSGIPDEDELEAVVALGSTLPEDASWFDLVDRDPLAAMEQATLEEHPLEGAILAHLPGLREVFRRPRTHIELRSALVLVGRARRLDPRADVRLASHTEDWEHLTLQGVQPRRVLAQVRDERLDLYENRVAVRLVDHLLRWLATRIVALERWLGVYQDLQRIQDQAGTEGSWRWRDRVFRLWGDANLEDNRRRLAELRLQRLLALRRRLDELRDTALYRAIPRRARVPDVLRASNALQHDANYRRVATLWREWARHRRHDEDDPDRHRQRQQDFAVGFNRFCRLLVVRALEQLGLEPDDIEAPLGSERVTIDGGVLDLTRTDALILQTPAGRPLRLVPLPVNLAGHRDRDVVVDALARLRGDGDVIVLHLALASQVPSEAAYVASLAHEREASGLSLLPVSPWDISSTERIARAIRWALLAHAFRAWPPRIHRPRGIELGSGWARQDGGEIEVLRPPLGRELDLMGLRTKRAELEGQAQALQAERDAVKQEAARSRDDRRRLKEANERAKRLNEDLKGVERERDALTMFIDGLDVALEQLGVVSRCPVCAALTEVAPSPLKPRGQGTFACSCDACSSTWGTVPCGCGTKVPFLRTPGARGYSAGDSVDSALGQDVLAVPVADAMEAVRCDQCGGEVEL